MAEKFSSVKSKRTPESFWRWFRNVNALGAVALAGVGLVLPQHQNLLFTGAAVNTAQAGGGEVMLRRKGKKKKKPGKSK